VTEEIWDPPNLGMATAVALRRPTAVALFGPPASGKSTLCRALAAASDAAVFRLREHVDAATMRATATTANASGWIELAEVARALRGFLADADHAGLVLLDNFPGSAEQVHQGLSILAEAASDRKVLAVELDAEDTVLMGRADHRRVCAACEADTAADPRLPAAASPLDAARCANCAGSLSSRPTDRPEVLARRILRYRASASGIRIAFTSQGHPVWALDGAATERRNHQLLTGLLSRGIDL
jgi:adenylate kinase